MEQALGDWAEGHVKEAINRPGDPWKAVSFGDSDKTMSEEEGFAEAYREGKRRELAFGKRSDLLLFDKDADVPEDFGSLSGEEAEALCSSCIAALEVRSSRTSAGRFIAYREAQKAAGGSPSKMEPGITVKIEDLGKVYRWVARNAKPLAYLQVFFDRVYGLNFLDVFRFIAAQGKKLKLEDPSRSGKKTIFIPISKARLVGAVVQPTFEIVHNELKDGRHDIYARPIGGNIDIVAAELQGLIDS
jgi:hypothetical protein